MPYIALIVSIFAGSDVGCASASSTALSVANPHSITVARTAELRTSSSAWFVSGTIR